MIKRVKLTLEVDGKVTEMPLTLCTTERDYEEECYKPDPTSNPNYDVLYGVSPEDMVETAAESFMEWFYHFMTDHNLWGWKELVSISEAQRRQHNERAITWHVEGTLEQAAEKFIQQHLGDK